MTATKFTYNQFYLLKPNYLLALWVEKMASIETIGFDFKGKAPMKKCTNLNLYNTNYED